MTRALSPISESPGGPTVSSTNGVDSFVTQNKKDMEDIPRETFEAGRDRRFGKSNPERMDVKFWNAMIKKGCWAYTARSAFSKDGDPFYGRPIWCHHRMGQTKTTLDDGRTVLIAGEHEDFYDPDFMIYNDVIVTYPDRKDHFEIYGYPEDVFPPTDFHTATLLGDWVYIIGNLGYSRDEKRQETPVFRLNLRDWSIERVEATGNSPGRIHDHTAKLKNHSIWISGGKSEENDGEEQRMVNNSDTWIFDVDRSVWAKFPES